MDTIGHRLVHIDLKGAPFRLDYWQQLIPCLSRLGITGLLIEYEDMFPYERSLSDLRCGDAYDWQDIETIITAANKHQLKIVPLIQTFGHMEFVLKGSAFRELREVDAYPNALCPTNDTSLDTVEEMLRQMIAGHQRWTQLDAIHIGCDEVWHLGHCQRCRQYLTDHCLADKSQLFLRYVRKVAEFVRKTFDIRVIVWDDMMRQIDDQTLADSGLNSLVEPMVWHYLDAQCFQLRDPELWSKYKHSFDLIWIASAFKGAAKMNQMLPPVDHYVSNHLAWVRVIEDNQLAERVAGLALTGWQRFDHMTTLCELMPNSMISLMMCLFAFNERDFNEDIQRNVSTFIGNKQLIPIDINSATDLEAIDSDVYPGVDLFKLCNKWQFLVKEFNELKSNQSLEGAFTSYQISLNRTNPLHIEAFLLNARVLLFRVQQMRLQIETEMKKIFYDTTVEEWIHTNVMRISKKLDKIVTNGDQQLATHVN